MRLFFVRSFGAAAIVAAFASLACASADFKLVQKATAYDTYFQDSYMDKCVKVQGPAECKPCHDAINDAARVIPLANKVQKIGPMPSQEVSEVKDVIKRLEACP